MKILTLAVFILLLCGSSFSQNIIQDNKGATSLSLNPGSNKSDKESIKEETVEFGLGQIKLSTAEKKLELNYYHYFRPDSRQPSFIGLSASGEIQNSVTSLLSSGEIAPGGAIKLKLGKRIYKSVILDYDVFEESIRKRWNREPTDAENTAWIKDLSNASMVWMVGNAVLSGSKFKLFQPDSPYTSQIKKINFTGWEANAGINFWHANLIKSTWLMGFTIGAKQENNFDDLSESVSEEVTIRTNAIDSSTRKVTEKNTLFKGKYAESKTYPLNIDLYFKPHKYQNVAFLIFGRQVIRENTKPQLKLGAGFYFLRKNNLFDPVFGINIDYKDVFNNDDTDDLKPARTKLKIGLVADLNSLLFQKKS